MKTRTRRGPLLALVFTTIAALTVAPAMAGHPTSSLGGSNFEIDDDANLAVDHEDTDDWASVGEFRQADAASGKDDTSYTGGAKEDDTCPSTSTGSIPPNKSDLLNFGVYQEAGSPGFLHLFWHRVQEPSGTTLMDFELNQKGTEDDCGNGANVERTPGDLLIEYRIEQGGARADILVREWTGTAWGPAEDLASQGLATGTINDSVIASGEADGLGEISPRTFGEASIDLDFLFDADVCTSFGSAFLKSRSSTSFTSALKDYIAPRDVDISNCGKIDIVKKDDAGAALQGATFTLYEDNSPTSADDGQTEPGSEDIAVTPSQTCTSAADGTCTIDNVLAGDYWVVETTTPANHDTAAPQPAVVDADTTVTLTFVNVRQRGSILVQKVDENGDALDGAAFQYAVGESTDDPATLTWTTLPASVNDGQFCVDQLAFDDYVVRESTAPDGYDAIADLVDVTVDSKSDCAARIGAGLDDETDPADTADATYENSPTPGRVLINKTDDAGTPMSGIEFELWTAKDDGAGGLEPDADTGRSCTTDAVGDCYEPDPTDADATAGFLNVDLGDYCIVEGTLPTGYDGDPDMPECFEVEVADGGDEHLFGVANPRQHRIVVLTCHEGTDTLVSSDVSLEDGTAVASFDGTGLSAAEQKVLCDLAASFGGLSGHDTHDLEVEFNDH